LAVALALRRERNQQATARTRRLRLCEASTSPSEPACAQRAPSDHLSGNALCTYPSQRLPFATASGSRPWVVCQVTRDCGRILGRDRSAEYFDHLGSPDLPTRHGRGTVSSPHRSQCYGLRSNSSSPCRAPMHPSTSASPLAREREPQPSRNKSKSDKRHASHVRCSFHNAHVDPLHRVVVMVSKSGSGAKHLCGAGTIGGASDDDCVREPGRHRWRSIAAVDVSIEGGCGPQNAVLSVQLPGFEAYGTMSAWWLY